MSETPEITEEDTKLLELFAGKQDIVHSEMRGDRAYLNFRECNDRHKTEQKSTIYHSVQWNDFESIKDVFTNGILRCLPTIKHMILILWIRKVKFEIDSPLINDSIYELAQGIFPRSGVELDDEEMSRALIRLVRTDYLREKNTKKWKRGYFLTPKAESAGEEMFRMVKMLISPHIEPPTEKNSELIPTDKTQAKTLTVPKIKIDYEKVVNDIYDARPETIFFTSDRLLALLKGLPGGENVTITESRIRHLKVWKKHKAARESGKEQYWEDMGNVTTEGKLAQNGEDTNDL